MVTVASGRVEERTKRALHQLSALFEGSNRVRGFKLGDTALKQALALSTAVLPVLVYLLARTETARRHALAQPWRLLVPAMFGPY